MYMTSDGGTYSTVKEDNKLVRLELPAGYVEVQSLLKAVERSMRHRSRRPFVSVERSYYVAPRMAPATPARTKSVRIEDKKPAAQKSSVPRSGEIVDWPHASSHQHDLSKHRSSTEYYGVNVSERQSSDSYNQIEFEDSTEDSGTDFEEFLHVNQDSNLPSAHATDLGDEDDLDEQKATLHMPPDDHSHPVNFDHDDDTSVTSSYQSSIFSIHSLASSASDLSKGSGYSTTQIDTAAREVLSIFRDDGVLQPLYTTAIYGIIGPRKFGHSFRRLLKAFADDLKDEAQDRLDFLAARLVALKARDIAEAILERYQSGHAPTLDVEEEIRGNLLQQDDGDSSDEDEQEETCVDETIFEELTNVREFLMQSTAFKLLQSSLQSFVSSREPSIETSNEQDKMHSKEQTRSHTKALDLRVRLLRLAEASLGHELIDMIKNDRPLRQLHMYTLTTLGEDRFFVEYPELLRGYYGLLCVISEKITGKETPHCAELISDWKPVVSDVVQYLQNADVEDADYRNGTPEAKAETSIFQAYLANGKIRRSPALDVFSGELACSTLRRPLQWVVSSRSRRDVEISCRNEMSFSNRAKAFFEDYTRAEWDWWPLVPRVPDIAPGSYRLQWEVRHLLTMRTR
jgi:hypothetical protein